MMCSNAEESTPVVEHKADIELAGSGAAAEVVGESSVRRKKHRRGKKRPKPADDNDGKSYLSTEQFVQFGKWQRCETNISPEDELAGCVRYSPKAPENYTQYLLNDQNDNFLKVNSDEGRLTDFLQAQFENDFKEERASELAGKSRTELLKIINELEDKKSRLMCCPRCSNCHLPKFPQSRNDELAIINTDEFTSDHSLSCTDESEPESRVEATPEDFGASSLYRQFAALQEENTRLEKLNNRLIASSRQSVL